MKASLSGSGMAPHLGGLAALGTRGAQTKFGRAWSVEMRCLSAPKPSYVTLNSHDKADEVCVGIAFWLTWSRAEKPSYSALFSGLEHIWGIIMEKLDFHGHFSIISPELCFFSWIRAEFRMKYALPTHRSRPRFGKRSLLVLIDPLCVVVSLAL